MPVLLIDVNDAEANKLLLAHDPLAAMAEANAPKLRELLNEVHTDGKGLGSAFASLKKRVGEGDEGKPNAHEPEIPEVFQIAIECSSEAEQHELYDRLTQEGYQCRVLTL